MLLLLPTLLLQVASTTDPKVEIHHRELRGSVLKDLDGKEFFSFQGIPYAKPPLGKLRFKLVPIHIQNRFGPSIERKSKHAFMAEPARNIIKKGNFDHKVQLMVGMTSADGSLSDVFYGIMDGVYNLHRTKTFIPYYFNLNPTQKTEPAKKLEDFYKTLPSPNDRVALQSDSYFTFPIYETIYVHLTWKQDIYVYQFSSKSELSILQNVSPAKDCDRVCHMEDMWYLYLQELTPKSASEAGSTENKAIKNSVKLLANFVKHGKPTLPGCAVKCINTIIKSISVLRNWEMHNEPFPSCYKLL